MRRMLPPQIKIIGIPGVPEVGRGDDLGDLIAAAVRRFAIGVLRKDVFVVAQKAVSKSEGRTLDLNDVKPSQLALDWGRRHGKDPRLVEAILRQARRIVRMDGDVLIVETEHGYVCANGGVDGSNTAPDLVALLPEDCDRSARRIRTALMRQFGVDLGVIVADSFGRPWRIGQTNVALGTAGLRPLIDYRGKTDSAGRKLKATLIAAADELASAAELVMGKTRRIPAAIVRWTDRPSGDGSGQELIRPRDEDLFR